MNKVILDKEYAHRFALAISDTNTIHLRDTVAQKYGLERAIVQNALLVAEISKYLGVSYPGEGTIIVKQEFIFKKPVYVGSEVIFEHRLVKATTDDNSKTKYTFRHVVRCDDVECMEGLTICLKRWKHGRLGITG